jgi:uncharacterized protein YkwD
MPPAVVRRRIVVVAISVLAATFITAQTPPSSALTPRTPKLAARFATSVLTILNDERRVHHLPPLRSNAHLIASAHQHNVAMARVNVLSHQLPHEAYFATRISRAGYHWSWAGENIGWNSDETLQGALQLERMMYHERAPDNGHRLNILSTHFTNVGVDIYFDSAHGKVWLTEDFGRPS